MAVLSVRNVPEELMLEAKVAACYSGQPLRSWVIDTISAAVGADLVDEAKGPRKAQRRRNSKPDKSNPQSNTATPTALSQSKSRAKVEPCRHGLLFHPGCND